MCIVSPLYPAVFCTYLIIVYENEDLTVLRERWNNESYQILDKKKARWKNSNLKDGKTESPHTQL